ncbi:HAD hydrolase-like protein [Homoserinibacter sp. GY 40078]|uniref:HAD hydrolase-like protein n=1 Tax=Homoserinibacter sp. GY 40078 TaxID=2603275 RepID=UPI0011CAF473|nr:HAD hydrolase-like protein [Homoserinibacter sp. GY 40078]TXK18845.1 HAD hydrolase-like protein [Homoserinibacter sp. GY 40078]
MTSRFTAILFDLDGTIVDSAPGILATLEHTYAELGKPVPERAELVHWIGPPILDSFRDRAGLDPEESQVALGIYRERYRTQGVFDATPYPGVVDLLHEIREAGIPLSLATSKPESMARLILDDLGATDAFTEITGASEDEVRSSKADVVEEALRRLAADGADLTRVVLVGDRFHDVEGAREHGIGTIFVNWGYGDPAEADGAIAVVDDIDQLRVELGL